MDVKSLNLAKNEHTLAPNPSSAIATSKPANIDRGLVGMGQLSATVTQYKQLGTFGCSPCIALAICAKNKANQNIKILAHLQPECSIENLMKQLKPLLTEFDNVSSVINIHLVTDLDAKPETSDAQTRCSSKIFDALLNNFECITEDEIHQTFDKSAVIIDDKQNIVAKTDDDIVAQFGAFNHNELFVQRNQMELDSASLMSYII